MDDNAATEVRIAIDALMRRIYPGKTVAHVLVLQHQDDGTVEVLTNAKHVEALPRILELARDTVQLPPDGRGRRPS